ncbi:tetratricopeptide repeat protein [Nonomuraea dietziae]|uniref:tetratricopeptide repeat protein n=1 Tax=Nonomuraea dietziae TaxID=65515 RepID=UPI0031DFD7A6
MPTCFDLANALNNHAALLAEVGRREEALPISEEAVALHRELIALNRPAHLPTLARTLTNHAARLAEAGLLDEALPVSEQAVASFQELVELNRDAYLPTLAISMANHAIWLAESGRREEALPVSEEAVAVCRELAELSRGAYLPTLASSLNNHANRLAEAGRPEEALPVSAEAVALRREQVKLNRNAYLPALADSLENQARWLAKAGRLEEALPVFQEAVAVCWELVELSEETYLPGYAQILAVPWVHARRRRPVPPGDRPADRGVHRRAATTRDRPGRHRYGRPSAVPRLCRGSQRSERRVPHSHRSGGPRLDETTARGVRNAAFHGVIPGRLLCDHCGPPAYRRTAGEVDDRPSARGSRRGEAPLPCAHRRRTALQSARRDDIKSVRAEASGEVTGHKLVSAADTALRNVCRAADSQDERAQSFTAAGGAQGRRSRGFPGSSA